MKNRLDIINESSTKTIKLIENLQKRNYNDMQEYATFCIELERQQSAQLLVEDWYKHIKNK